jgi:hypothetical protein
MGKYQLGFRGWWALFRRNWYSLYRWNNPEDYNGYKVKVIDFGVFYFAQWTKI